MLNSLRKTKIANSLTKTIIFTGGMNEEVSNLELKAGELTDCINYVEQDGSANGYTSVEGYERFDGRTAPSSAEARKDNTGYSNFYADFYRSKILPIPGSGDTTGVAIYDNDVYGFRDNAAASAAEMYKSTTSGWSKITSATMAAGGTVRSINARFSAYNTNNMALYWVDGVSDLHVYNGSAVSTITHANLPASKPTLVGEWNNRIFIAFPKGHLFFSAIGDPTDFDPLTGAGEIYLGDDITGIVNSPSGSLIIMTKNTIQEIKDTTPSSTGIFAFLKDVFSPNTGAIEDTVQRMFGTLYFADDRGITTLEAVQEYGDFSANSLAKKLEKTYQSIKSDIVAAVSNRKDNQYILYYNVAGTYSEGLVFSFKGKYLKGVTKIQYNHPITCITEGKDSDRNNDVYFGSEGGWVYKAFSGTSFDGEVINTYLKTSFYHYNSPTLWKHFKNVLFEISGRDDVSFTLSTNYDYNDTSLPSPDDESYDHTSPYDHWGESTSKWGTFIWNPSSLIRAKQLIMGYGTTMQLVVSTSEKYKEPHSIHNAVVIYNKGAQRH